MPNKLPSKLDDLRRLREDGAARRAALAKLRADPKLAIVKPQPGKEATAEGADSPAIGIDPPRFEGDNMAVAARGAQGKAPGRTKKARGAKGAKKAKNAPAAKKTPVATKPRGKYSALADKLRIIAEKEIPENTPVVILRDRDKHNASALKAMKKIRAS